MSDPRVMQLDDLIRLLVEARNTFGPGLEVKAIPTTGNLAVRQQGSESWQGWIDFYDIELHAYL